MATEPFFNKFSSSAYEHGLLFILTLFALLVSTVMAESRLKLDFPHEFYTQSLTDKKFVRGGKDRKETDNDARKWGGLSHRSENKSRWKNVELYYGSDGNQRKQSPDALHDRFSTHHLELEPQFEMRF